MDRLFVRYGWQYINVEEYRRKQNLNNNCEPIFVRQNFYYNGKSEKYSWYRFIFSNKIYGALWWRWQSQLFAKWWLGFYGWLFGHHWKQFIYIDDMLGFNQKAIDPIFTIGQHEKSNVCFSSRSYFDLEKRTLSKNCNMIIYVNKLWILKETFKKI